MTSFDNTYYPKNQGILQTAFSAIFPTGKDKATPSNKKQAKTFAVPEADLEARNTTA